jgi:hypothetical protein
MAATIRKLSILIALAGAIGCVIGSSLAMSAPLPELSLWRYVHPKSKALVGMQWSKVQKSELGRWLQQKWIKNLTIPGTEFLKDVDEVLISSPGVQSGAEEEDPALMIAIRGHFDLTRIRLVLARQNARLQMFDSIPIYRQKGKPDSEPAFALLNPQTILIGEPQSLFSTIERSKLVQAEEEPGTFTARAQAMAAKYDCWALMNDSGSMHNFLFAALAGKAISPDSQGFEAGISVTGGFSMDVLMKVGSEHAAKVLHGNVNRVIHLAAADKGSDFQGLLQKLKIASDKSGVALTLRMSNLEVAKSLHLSNEPKDEKPLLAENPPHLQQADRKVTPPPPPPPPKLVIRIEGLDDGPREVPYKP